MNTHESNNKSTTTFKFAGIQLLVSDDKNANLERAKSKIKESSSNGAKVVCLPEMFNCPYSNDSFPPYSETIPGDISSNMLSQAAKDNQIYLIGGSIPEKDSQGKLYNTCLVYDPNGNLIAKHRKVHLFDIDIPGKMTFQESKTLTGGDSITFFDTKFGAKIGIGICYDIRFSELALITTRQGCKMLCYPGAFNMTTGPLHWELLQRGRAVDNQLYVAAISPARNPNTTYQAWGHSTVVDPWAKVISTTDENESIIYADIDFEIVDQVRNQIPITKQRREDIYKLNLIQK